MKRYKGAIFDLDGTLVDTLQDIADAMNYVLEQRELPLFDYERYKYFVGKGLRMLVDQVVPPATDQETAEQIYREMIDRYRNRLVEKSVLYEVLPNFWISWWKERYNYPYYPIKPTNWCSRSSVS